jgi:Outer membrane protein beta-barrel domain
VFGVDAQGDWAGLSGSNASILAPGDLNRSRMDAFGLFTGQVGYAWNTTLLYLKGGAAVVADRNDILAGGAVVATAPGDNRWGGTVGAGVEYSFVPNWSVAVEYDHLFIGNDLSPSRPPPARSSAPTAFTATPISSPLASTTASAARSSPNTDLGQVLILSTCAFRFSYERPAWRRPFCCVPEPLPPRWRHLNLRG